MLDQLINSAVFHKWPVDLLRIVDEYGASFTFYVLGDYQGVGLSQHIYECKDNILRPLTVVPTPRRYPAIVRVERYLYVLCGNVDSLVERFDLKTSKWCIMPPVPLRVDHAMAAVLGSKIYLAGTGCELFIYDTIGDKWTTGPSLTRDSREEFTVAGSRLFAIGHCGTFYLEDKTWIQAVTKHYHDCCRFASMRDELIFGFSCEPVSSSLSIYSIANRRWYLTGEPILPPRTLALTYDGFDECLYAITRSTMWRIPCKKIIDCWEFGSPSLIMQFPSCALNGFNTLFV